MENYSQNRIILLRHAESEHNKHIKSIKEEHKLSLTPHPISTPLSSNFPHQSTPQNFPTFSQRCSELVHKFLPHSSQPSHNASHPGRPDHVVNAGQSCYSKLQKLKKTLKVKDETISQMGYEQCVRARKLINWEEIGVVIVSPMRRCLETCRVVMAEVGRASKRVPVYVEPLLASRFGKTWAIGSPKQELMKEFPQFQFSSLMETESQPWYIKNFTAQKQQLALNNPSLVLSLELQQTNYELKNRLKRLQKVLTKHCSELEEKQKILIISHSCIFKTMTSNNFSARQNEKKKWVSQLKFKHCVPVQITYGQIVWENLHQEENISKNQEKQEMEQANL